MLTIELVTDGPNVFVDFDAPYNPKKPTRVYTSAQARSLLKRTEFDWKKGEESDLRYAACPVKALEWLLESGYDAVSEEQQWLKTGEWPE